jgi:DNA polymerase phi
LSYTLKRLIKGLASSRKAARQGFAMALTEIILMFDTITVEDIINFMKDSLTVTKSSSSQVFILSTKCLVFGNMVFATNSF